MNPVHTKWKEMRVAAIIQARMGSTRLPGKVLRDIGGRTMLEWVASRTIMSTLVDRTIVAIPSSPPNDAIADLCVEAGVEVFRGSEDDVLDRYYQCARGLDSDVVVRITSDCPLTDPDLIDEVVKVLLEEGSIDYCANTLPPRTYPRGFDVEAFRFEALKRAWEDAQQPFLREHVTPYIYMSPSLFRLKGIYNTVDLSGIRVTVDTEADLSLVRSVLEHFRDASFGWRDVVRFIGERPWLRDLNKDVRQKALYTDK